jgi:hypothetical protein
MTSQVIFSENGLKSSPQFQEKYKNKAHGSVFALNVKFIEKISYTVKNVIVLPIPTKLSLAGNYYIIPGQGSIG